MKALEAVFYLILAIIFIFVILPWAASGMSDVAHNALHTSTPALP